ncbi:MAG: hypothetical protein LBV26_03245 [Bacteroidales bacterium]|nr:hypothetical protein [Bacteroidales bacterium]
MDYIAGNIENGMIEKQEAIEYILYNRVFSIPAQRHKNGCAAILKAYTYTVNSSEIQRRNTALYGTFMVSPTH